jgi:hypothetical protein
MKSAFCDELGDFNSEPLWHLNVIESEVGITAAPAT